MAIEQIAFLIVGIFNIIFGFLIKKFKLANFLTFYNPKKDKENRTEVEKIAGDSFSLMGVFMIFLVVLGHFTNMNQDYFVITQVSILVGFVLLMILMTNNLRKTQ